MRAEMTELHLPVLAGELIELTDPRPGEAVVDCTFGGGGHASLLAERVGPSGSVICIDRDASAEPRFAEFSALSAAPARFIHSEFSAALADLRDAGERADIVLLDLGVSSMQLDTRERGFSYSFDAPLDMRMDVTQELSARTIVNEWDQRRIAALLREYGEERYALAIARGIVRARARAPIETTGHLVELISAAIPAPARFAAGHPAKRVFQAIRIAVNGELDALATALPLAWSLLNVGGRLAVISFHSLEDRPVKRFIADLARDCVCPPDFPICVCGRSAQAEPMTRRAIMASPGEVATNHRSKSGRMRVARKLIDAGDVGRAEAS